MTVGCSTVVVILYIYMRRHEERSLTNQEEFSLVSFLACLLAFLHSLATHGDRASNSRKIQAFRPWMELAQGLACKEVQEGCGGCKEHKAAWTRRPKTSHPLPQSGTGSHIGVLVILL